MPAMDVLLVSLRGERNGWQQQKEQCARYGQ